MLHKNNSSTRPLILQFRGNELKEKVFFSIIAEYHRKRESINERRAEQEIGTLADH